MNPVEVPAAGAGAAAAAGSPPESLDVILHPPPEAQNSRTPKLYVQSSRQRWAGNPPPLLRYSEHAR